MRSIVHILILFLACSFGGYWAFSRPRGQGWALLADRAKLTGSSGDALEANGAAQSTDAKAQRFIVAAKRKGKSIERENELYLAIEALTAEDFRRLMTDLGALKAMMEELDGIDYDTARNLSFGLIGRWLEVDPGAVLTWMPRVFELIPAEARGLALDPLAATRPEELLALVPSQKKASERAAIISRALVELAAKDLSKAQAWLNACTDPADRQVAEKAIRKGIVKADPLRAVELAARVVDRQERYELVASAAAQAARIGPGMLRQLAMQPMKGGMLPAVLNEFAAQDPELAADLALKSDSAGSEKNSTLRTAFGALARRDHDLAIAKLDGLSGAERASATAAIGSSWALEEPEAALAWLAEKPAIERNDQNGSRYGSHDALLVAFSNWAENGPDAARAWADAMPAGESRDAVQTQLARVFAAKGNVAEATQILSRMGDAADPKVLSSVASAWAQRDPAAAADWAIGQPAGAQQNRAIAGVVGAWAGDDPHSAAAWLEQFPPGEARDRSIVAYLGRSTTQIAPSPNQIAEFDAWFDRIDDPWQRSQAAVRSFWSRRGRDPEGAREWLSSLQNVDPSVIRVTLLNDRR